MSQEQNQTDQQNTPQNFNSQPPKKNNTIMYWVVIGVLLVACIYLFFAKRQVVQENIVMEEQRDEAVQSRDTLQVDYNAALARLDMLVGKNSQLDSLVNNKESEIVRLKSQIQNILSNSRSTANDFARAKELIAQLNTKVKSYEERIAELESENSRLSNYSQLMQEERDETVAKNISLAQKVRLGALLHASNIRMSPIDLRKSGRKEKQTEKASRVDIFRISFDIDENRIAEAGDKDLFLRIIDPKGNLFNNKDHGSGASTTYDGQTLNYSTKKQIFLKEGEPVKNVVVDWQKDKDYAAGNYTIEIYYEGYKIGSGNVQLK